MNVITFLKKIYTKEFSKQTFYNFIFVENKNLYYFSVFSQLFIFYL